MCLSFFSYSQLSWMRKDASIKSLEFFIFNQIFFANILSSHKGISSLCQKVFILFYTSLFQGGFMHHPTTANFGWGSVSWWDLVTFLLHSLFSYSFTFLCPIFPNCFKETMIVFFSFSTDFPYLFVKKKSISILFTQKKRLSFGRPKKKSGGKVLYWSGLIFYYFFALIFGVVICSFSVFYFFFFLGLIILTPFFFCNFILFCQLFLILFFNKNIYFSLFFKAFNLTFHSMLVEMIIPP